MNRRLARAGLVAALILLVVPALASAAGPWKALSRTALAARGAAAKVETQPARFKAFTLDRAALDDAVAGAPAEQSTRAGAIVTLPDPTGTLVRFRAVASPVMAPALARKLPDVKTFAATGIDDPTATARFDTTPLGVHASVRSDAGSWYVDPYYRGDTKTYVSYFARDLEDARGPLTETEAIPSAVFDPTPPVQRAGAEIKRREYRLALSSDPAYSKYFDPSGTQPDLVDAAKAVLMNRVNQVYNDDLAIRLILIANNDQLKFADNAAFLAAGYPAETEATTCSDTLDENTGAINAIVGFGTYDIGHIVMGVAGGGVAGLGVVGTDSKGRGCTGIPTPKGDFFAVDYVAHEMGHEFGGNHTFASNGGSCAINRSQTTSVEPGSGSSVMAYAGICANDNLQAHSDPYFSQRSIDEIQAYVASDQGTNTTDGKPATNGGTQLDAANHAPELTVPANATIPLRTPFTLEGDGTDAEGEPLVYTWEQNNNTLLASNLTANGKLRGPLFRQFGLAATEADPLTSPAIGENIATAADRIRSFPDPAQVAAGNTNAESGTCPFVTQGRTPTPEEVDCFSEFLPTITYTQSLAFRLTARDRHLTGGGVAHRDVTLSTQPGLPFSVDSQAEPSTVAGNAGVDLTWTVAGTAAAPYNAPQVKVSYSTDGGLTFPITLLASTANDGSESVTIPNTATTQGRLRVAAIGNYFYDVNDGDITVTQAPGPVVTPDGSPTTSPDPTGTPAPTGETATQTPAPAATASPTAAPTTTATPSRATVRPDLSVTPRKAAGLAQASRADPGALPRQRRHRGARPVQGVRAVVRQARQPVAPHRPQELHGGARQHPRGDADDPQAGLQAAAPQEEAGDAGPCDGQRRQGAADGASPAVAAAHRVALGASD